MRNNNKPMLNRAGSEMTRANSSFRIPFAALINLRTLPILKTRITLNNVGLSSRSARISSRIISEIEKKRIRAVTHDFQQCGILTSVDSDEPVQPPFKTPKDVQSVAQQ